MGRALNAKEVEAIMGFRKQHTKYHGHVENSQATRRKMLGNSFQVRNIAYLLSPLKVCMPLGSSASRNERCICVAQRAMSVPFAHVGHCGNTTSAIISV